MNRLLTVGILSALFCVSCATRVEKTVTKDSNNALPGRPIEQETGLLSYEVLSKWGPDPWGNPSSTLQFKISLNQYVGRVQMEGLICEIVAQEDHPEQYDSFIISFYYQLTEYITYMLSAGKEQAKHAIGSYGWNRGLPDNPYALQLYRDLEGNRLKDNLHYAFDHLKDCSQERAAENR